jgi:hypothetical protein
MSVFWYDISLIRLKYLINTKMSIFLISSQQMLILKGTTDEKVSIDEYYDKLFSCLMVWKEQTDKLIPSSLYLWVMN